MSSVAVLLLSDGPSDDEGSIPLSTGCRASFGFTVDMAATSTVERSESPVPVPSRSAALMQKLASPLPYAEREMLPAMW